MEIIILLYILLEFFETPWRWSRVWQKHIDD